MDQYNRILQQRNGFRTPDVNDLTKIVKDSVSYSIRINLFKSLIPIIRDSLNMYG